MDEALLQASHEEEGGACGRSPACEDGAAAEALAQAGATGDGFDPWGAAGASLATAAAPPGPLGAAIGLT